MGKKKDTGKNFENEIRRSLVASKHIWWFRIQDTNDINRSNPPISLAYTEESLL